MQLQPLYSFREFVNGLRTCKNRYFSREQAREFARIAEAFEAATGDDIVIIVIRVMGEIYHTPRESTRLEDREKRQQQPDFEEARILSTQMANMSLMAYEAFTRTACFVNLQGELEFIGDREIDDVAEQMSDSFTLRQERKRGRKTVINTHLGDDEGLVVAGKKEHGKPGYYGERTIFDNPDTTILSGLLGTMLERYEVKTFIQRVDMILARPKFQTRLPDSGGRE